MRRLRSKVVRSGGPDGTFMNLPKLFQKNSETDSERSERAQKSDAARKNASRSEKPKKTDGAKKPARKADEPRVDYVNRVRQYLREVSHELRKVVWPSRKETLGSTAVVLLLVALSGIFLGIVDLVLSRLVRSLVG